MQILIVDDDEYVRRLLSQHLTSEGHTVSTAEGSKEALLINQSIIDVCIIDISCGLPPENRHGLEFARYLHYLAKQEGRRLPILITYHRDMAKTVGNLGEFAGRTLEKPFADLEQVTEALGRACSLLPRINPWAMVSATQTEGIPTYAG